MLDPWKESYDKPRQHIKKQRHHLANKGPNSQSYGFSRSHVWMWELDYKEGWTLKNWCFRTMVLEKTLESPLDCKEIQPIHSKGNQSWIFIGRIDAEAEAPILWPPDAKNQLIRKDPDAGIDWRQEEKGATEDEMVGRHHRLNGHEVEQTLRDSERQGSLACFSPWGCKELNTTWWLNNNQNQRTEQRGHHQEKCSQLILIWFLLFICPSLAVFCFKTFPFLLLPCLSIAKSEMHWIPRWFWKRKCFFLIFKIYNIVIVLPHIEMNLPQVYLCSPSWTLLSPPSPYHPSGSSQCTSPKHPVSCIEPGLATRFIHDIIHVSMLFSQISPPSPSPTESVRLIYTSVSLLLSRTQGYCYHLSKFHIYALVYCIGVFLSGLLHAV